MTSILITTSSFQVDGSEILQSLKADGYEIITNPYGRRLTEEEVQTLIREHDPVGMIAGVEPLTRSVLEAAKNLKVISRCGIGMESVDLEAAKDQDIVVINTPDAPSQAVSELAIGLILSALRKIPLADRLIRQNQWTGQMGNLLGGKMLGLVGCGRIGGKVAEIASAFGAEIMVFDPFVQNVSCGRKVEVLDDLLGNADIVSLHLPGSDATHHLIGAEQIEHMKSTALLVNTSRGSLIDEEALVDALKLGKLAGAALDVFETEPYKGELATLDNVVLTAHMGSRAAESRQNMEREAAAHLASYLGKLVGSGDRKN